MSSPDCRSMDEIDAEIDWLLNAHYGPFAEMEPRHGRRLLRFRGDSTKNQLENTKIIKSGDAPLCAFPPELVDDDELSETWTFLCRLFECLAIEESEVRRVKKIRRRIAAPILTGLHVVGTLVSDRLTAMEKEMSVPEFDESLAQGKASKYCNLAECALNRYDIWMENNESIQDLMFGFEIYNDLKLIMWACTEAKLLWSLLESYEDEDRTTNIQIGLPTDSPSLIAAINYINSFYKILTHYIRRIPVVPELEEELRSRLGYEDMMFKLARIIPAKRRDYERSGPAIPQHMALAYRTRAAGGPSRP